VNASRKFEDRRDGRFLRLKFERLKRDLTQEYVARATDISMREYCLIEQGRCTPTEDQLDRLGRRFLITPASVLLKEVTALRDPDEQASTVKA
jgi:transcriptional regulator with XRE-family HTH domain